MVRIIHTDEQVPLTPLQRAFFASTNFLWLSSPFDSFPYYKISESVSLFPAIKKKHRSVWCNQNPVQQYYFVVYDSCTRCF